MKGQDCRIKKLGRRLLEKDIFLIAILIGLSFYLFVFKLGGPSLWETDEPIYGEVAKEILKTGDWITLRFNYKEWFDKPPLYMWITALFYSLWGWNEFTTRITSALFGIGHVIAVYFFGKVLFNRKVGFFSALVLATSFQFIVQSRLALLDIPLSFFISLSFLFFYLGTKNPDKNWCYLLSFLCMGFATLTKGPIGAIIPVAVIGIYLVLIKNLDQLRRMKLSLAILIFLFVASPWYIIEFLRHGRVFIDKFFLLRTISRYTTPFEGHTGPFYYYFGILFLGFFPWSSFLPLSFFNLLKKGKRKKSFFVLTWFVFIFVFFSSAKSKLPGYILPLYPACALSVGKLWEEILVSKNTLSRKGLHLSFALLFILLLILAFVLLFVAKASFPAEYKLFEKYLFLLVAGLFVGGATSFVFATFKKNTFLPLAGIIGMMCFLVWILTIYILPKLEVFKPTKFLAKKITRVIEPNDKIGNYPASDDNFMSFNCSLVYYTDHPVVGIEDKKKLKEFLASKERVFCVMREENYQKVKEALNGTPLYILEKKKGDILLSNKK